MLHSPLSSNTTFYLYRQHQIIILLFIIEKLMFFNIQKRTQKIKEHLVVLLYTCKQVLYYLFHISPHRLGLVCSYDVIIIYMMILIQTTRMNQQLIVLFFLQQIRKQIEYMFRCSFLFVLRLKQSQVSNKNVINYSFLVITSKKNDTSLSYP